MSFGFVSLVLALYFNFQENEFSSERRLPCSDDAVKFLKDFCAGAFAAVVAKTVMAIIERIKLILQVISEISDMPNVAFPINNVTDFTGQN